MVSSEDVTFHIISLGCSKNLVDSEKLNAELLGCGFIPAQSAESSDLVFINTCGFIEDAKKEAIDTIFESLSLKGALPHPVLGAQKIIVLGCFSKRYFDDVQSDIPEIDFAYGLYDDAFVPALAAALEISYSPRALRHGQCPLTDGCAYAYIKIAEGCSNNCSYCAIPIIRGPLVCFDPDDIMRDAEEAAARGVKELILVGQDTASYRFGSTGFGQLVQRVCGIAGIEWVRVLYMHPDRISGEIMCAYKTNGKLVPYFDIPFQHVNRRILASMNRTGDYDTYRSLVTRIREEIPRAVIRSTFMIGYPGETEEEFAELMRFVKESKLDKVGCFTYSKEESTPACSLEPDVSERTKTSRLNKLMKAQKTVSEKKLSERVGTTVRVLVEEHAGGDEWIGRSEYDAPEVDGIFYLTAAHIELNTIVNALVTDSVEYDLIGKI